MEKGFIRKEDDEEDKRKKNVYLLVEPETLVTSIDERIQRIGTSAKTLCEQYIWSLLNKDFRAFHKGAKIGTTSPESRSLSENGHGGTINGNPENNVSLINSILSISGYSILLLDQVVPIFSTARVLKDFNVAWNDRDWNLHAGDVLELDSELVRMLVDIGIAQNLNIGDGKQ